MKHRFTPRALGLRILDARGFAGTCVLPARSHRFVVSKPCAFQPPHNAIVSSLPELRLGGDALGADPTYLLYLPSRPRGELRRIDFDPDCAGATLSDFAASESTRKPLLHTRGISRARSFDLEVTPWAPTRLTSSIFHSGHTKAYEPLRSTRRPACTPFRDLATPESARKPLLHTRGISRAISFDLEVTPWTPTRLTSCISLLGPEESSGASTLSQTAQVRP